jgi:uncharacterized membrane protein (UPF0127 family)
MKTGIISVGHNVFETLLAISAQEQERGLMYIEPPTPNMAFIYERPGINKFWMANTRAPLDIVFCYAGKVTQICVGEPFSTTMIGDNKFSDLVVEFPFGTVAYSGIKLGHSIDLLKPTADELKQIIAEKYHGIVKI